MSASPDSLSTATPALSVKRLVYPLLAHPRAKQTLKWIVYSALIVNTFFYLGDDIVAFLSAVPEGTGFISVLFEFATTIDMVAWLGLVFLFELETYAISDAKWTPLLERTVRGLRFLCYALIGFAAVGYTVESLDTFDLRPVAGMQSMCEVADQGVYAQTRANEYPEITSESCAELSDGDAYYTFADELAIVSSADVPHLQLLYSMDIENAYIWILVVLLIELEVWMQSADRFGSRSLAVARRVKTGFYLVLVLNGIVWAWFQYWLYAWDAFLWIFGFWAIELNLAEWEQDRLEELQHA